MNLEELPEAVEALYSYIVAFNPILTSMERVLEEYDVTEAAVRARFEAHYRLTPEEVAQRHVTDHTIDGYLNRFRQANSDYHPSRIEHLGKRFYLIVDDKEGGEVKRWFRFLIVHGAMAVVVDEVTNRQGEIYDSEILDDIARQIGWKRWSHWPEVGPQPSRQRFKPV